MLKKTICPYDCPTTCGFSVETDGKKIIKIKEDKNDPASGGIICQKIRHYERDIQSKDRILTPLKRVGKKGEGKFKTISWNEAIKEIGDKWREIIKEYGPEAIAFCNFSGVMSIIQRNCGNAFFHYMGARELVKTLCSTAKGEGYKAVLGTTGALDPRETVDSDFYLVWGSQMAATRLQGLSTLIKERKKGKKVILVEVLADGMEPYCDDIFLIKPGTDGALALSMMHVLKREHLIDEEFLRQESIGYDIFAKTLEQYTPEWAQKETGIPATKIEELAMLYGKAKSPAIILGSGNSRYINGGMTVRLITILSLMTRAWKYPGGGLCGCNSKNIPSYVRTELIARPDFRKNNPEKININQIAAATSENVKEKLYSLYVYGSNPANSVSNQVGMYESLSRENLFTVVHERFMTDTARYADIILPATFSVEQSDLYSAYGYNTLGTSWKIIEPLGESKSNWNTFCLLAKEMGFQDPYFQHSEEEMLEYLLENLSDEVNLSKENTKVLREGGNISMPFANHTEWKTVSGKIQIINETEKEKIPCYIKATKENNNYPLRIISVPAVQTLNSIFLNRQELIEKKGKIKLMMHPKDAQKRGIYSGDRVICFNELAEVEFQVVLTENIAKGAVAVPGVFRSDQTFNGLGVNALQHDRLSDIGAATTMNDNTVEVRRK